MKLKYLGVIVLFLLFPLVPAGGANVFAAVVINEIYPKPSDETGEWVELFNSGAQQVSLDRWRLENSSGEVKSFTINASGIIAAGGFLTLPRSQTGINLVIDGDTVKLFNENGTLVDSQSYPGTLGYNTSVGRYIDGAGAFTVCNEATYNKANKCPEPTATPSPLPTTTPLPTLTPLAVESPPPAVTSRQQEPPAGVLGATDKPFPTPSATPTPPDDVLQINVPNTITLPKSVAVQIAIVAGAWVLLAAAAFLQRKFVGRRRKKQSPPTPPAV